MLFIFNLINKYVINMLYIPDAVEIQNSECISQNYTVSIKKDNVTTLCGGSQNVKDIVMSIRSVSIQ